MALADVSADFDTGKLHAIVERSGAGKSTLLNMIAGIDRVNEGQVYVDATPIHTLSEDRLAAWHGRNLGVVYQSFELLCRPCPCSTISCCPCNSRAPFTRNTRPSGV